jgi:hypothetical protein
MTDAGFLVAHRWSVANTDCQGLFLDGMLYAKRRLPNEPWHDVGAVDRLCCPLNVMLLEHAAGKCLMYL